MRFAVSIAVISLILAGCASVEPGRSLGREIDDVNASVSVKSAMLRAEGYALSGVDLEVTEGVALLSGSAPRPADRVHAECLAWSSPAVRSVTNEISIGGGRGPGRALRDTWLTQRVRARLLTDSAVRSVNFNVETYDRVVYLLGYARSVGERERAAEHASLVDGVERVVVLVRAEGETRELPARGEHRAEMCDAQSAPAPAA
ncbi:transport-associated protein [Marinicauda salina]|uniref:Transport-associated protein n=1 Tax=Marinicauda salina TaxID=2135793 RepID=A0A2U2BWP4_9PROT|nr:BON domain-containing protein [Marinicauda salina]PWE18399.1 transport-associated protein [Marinicauda salina]